MILWVLAHNCRTLDIPRWWLSMGLTKRYHRVRNLCELSRGKTNDEVKDRGGRIAIKLPVLPPMVATQAPPVFQPSLQFPIRPSGMSELSLWSDAFYQGEDNYGTQHIHPRCNSRMLGWLRNRLFSDVGADTYLERGTCDDTHCVMPFFFTRDFAIEPQQQNSIAYRS